MTFACFETIVPPRSIALEFTELYSTPQHVGWITIIYVVALNIFNLINPVQYRFRQIFRLQGVLIVKYMTGTRTAYKMLIGKPHHLDDKTQGYI